MTLKEIIEIENANKNSINLYKEGIFWRVYNQSAYYFVKHIKELKALKKFYKNVNCEVVYAGFPDTILSQIEALSQSKGLQFEKCGALSLSKGNEKQCSISGVDFDNGFEEWKNSIKVSAPIQSLAGSTCRTGRQQTGNKNYVSNNLPGRIITLNDGYRNIANIQQDEFDKRKEAVIEKLKGYSLANHTPIEAMQLVMDLQKELAVFKPE